MAEAAVIPTPPPSIFGNSSLIFDEAQFNLLGSDEDKSDDILAGEASEARFFFGGGGYGKGGCGCSCHKGGHGKGGYGKGCDCCDKKGLIAFQLFALGAIALFIFLQNNPAPAKKKRSAEEAIEELTMEWASQMLPDGPTFHRGKRGEDEDSLINQEDVEDEDEDVLRSWTLMQKALASQMAMRPAGRRRWQRSVDDRGGDHVAEDLSVF